MGECLDDWFARDVLVHEAALVQYLTHRCADKEEIHELRQEIYRRVYEAAEKEQPQSAGAVLFATAQQVLTARGKPAACEAGQGFSVQNVLVDEAAERAGGTCGPCEERGEVVALVEVLNRLPPDYRRLVWMRRVEQKSQREIATCLGISEAMVERRIAESMRLLADLLFGCQAGETGKADRAVTEDPAAQQRSN